jgi:hypothetical protein
MSYVGVPPFGQTVRTITEVTATAGQTTFTPSGGYLPGYIDVSLNGSALSSADFTATNGTTVTLTAAAAVGDEFRCVAYWPVSLMDTYRKGETDTLLAAKQPLSNNLTTYASTGIGFRNRIINGDMRIDQRNAGASVTANNAVFGVDRWKFQATQTAKGTLQQSSAAPSGFSNSLLFTSSSAYSVTSTDFFVHTHNVEGYNIADFAWGTANAQTVTLSFWVRSSLTGTFGGVLQNNAQDYNHPFSFAISAANTWEQKTVTITGPTSGVWLSTNGRGVNLLFGLGVGSTYSGTAGAWTTSNVFSATGATSVVGTSGATFYITGVQLEAGSVATPFERRAYGQELMMCQRYYSTVRLNAGFIQASALGSDGTSPYYVVPFNYPVQMRATPTVTSYGYSNIGTSASDGGYGTYTADITGNGWKMRVASGSGASTLIAQCSAEL